MGAVDCHVASCAIASDALTAPGQILWESLVFRTGRGLSPSQAGSPWPRKGYHLLVIAIVPAAGRGTRMMAVTGGMPKELLPLGSRCVLARIIEEAREAGFDGAVVVNARSKPEVDEAVLKWSTTMFADFPVRIEYQDEARGLAHAVAAARVDDDAVIMVGDVVYGGGSPIERMANLIHRGIDGCVAVEAVQEAQMHLYGIVDVDEASGSISRILEKPSPDQTASRWAVASRWAFSKQSMAYIGDYCSDPVRLANPKEIFLTEIINAAIALGMDYKAVALQPGQERIDCGGVAEYEAAKRMRWN